jgi:transposase
MRLCAKPGGGGGAAGREASYGPKIAAQVNVEGIEEVVADKGYHSGAVLERVKSYGCAVIFRRRSRKGGATGRARPEEQQAVYGNRRRVQGEYGKSLLKRRGELVERSFAHCYETGGMRRCHLRGRKTF